MATTACWRPDGVVARARRGGPAVRRAGGGCCRRRRGAVSAPRSGPRGEGGPRGGPAGAGPTILAARARAGEGLARSVGATGRGPGERGEAVNLGVGAGEGAGGGTPEACEGLMP